MDSALREIDQRLARALPGARIASYASTGSDAFVSDDGRTAFALVYPRPDLDAVWGQNAQAERDARAAIKGMTVAGEPVHLTGFDALQQDAGGDDDPGVLLEALIGGLGALAVLAFVFASLLAIVPIVMAIASIMTTFLLLLGLTRITDVSPVVQFLVALVGLGVAIDYALLVVSRWREERAHGRSGDEAVQRAMETAGRAVVFSGLTVAIGLLALIALTLPFLRSMGYGGMLIPLVSVIVAITLLPVVLASIGPRLDWSHRRTDNRASRAWTRWAQAVSRRRWLAAGAGLASWLPLTVFAFLFGISMDYEVFILARMREEHDRTGSTETAVVQGIGRTGRLVTSAALILFLAFVSMASGPGTDLKMFATGLAAGILLDATVIRALIVPAVIVLMGRWNWWLPSWPARVLRVKPSPLRPAAA